jgi:hypothetical protein
VEMRAYHFGGLFVGWFAIGFCRRLRVDEADTAPCSSRCRGRFVMRGRARQSCPMRAYGDAAATSAWARRRLDVLRRRRAGRALLQIEKNRRDDFGHGRSAGLFQPWQKIHAQRLCLALAYRPRIAATGRRRARGDTDEGRHARQRQCREMPVHLVALSRRLRFSNRCGNSTKLALATD